MIQKHLAGKHNQQNHGRRFNIDLSSRVPIGNDVVFALSLFESIKTGIVGGQDSIKRKINRVTKRSGLDRHIVKSWIKEWDRAATGTVISDSLQETAAEMFGIKSNTVKANVNNTEQTGSRPAGVNYMARKLMGSLVIDDTPLQEVDDKVMKRAAIDAKIMRRKFLQAIYDETQDALFNASIKEMTVYRGINSNAAPNGPIQTTESTLSSWSANIEIANEFALAKQGAVLVTTIPASRIFSLSFTGIGMTNEQELVILGGPIVARKFSAQELI